MIFKNNKDLESTGFPIKRGMTRLGESGSIMLEVVAVLALMGVMGAMLFRQIYQRNQELHNIQMASEIRTVKEAFSAYIQANRSLILSSCTVPICNDEGCSVPSCTVDNATYSAVASYLPDGWFAGAEDLQAAYTLTLWNYLSDDASGRRVVYGIVIPTAQTLPTTGWNFRRAARVALLIGADGGAYDATITGGSIAGALGSWIIGTSDLSGSLPKESENDMPTYVAMTGIDIFAPEYEAPEGDMKLPENWSLALKGLHAYNHFSVGNSGSGNCYAIQHDHYASTTTGDNVTGKVENDTVPNSLSETCKPLFWVGEQKGGANASAGNVYVATDLKIGDIETVAGAQQHNEALTLTKEGVIKQKDGLTIDADGRIIASETLSKAIGDLAEGEHFVLDPAYTSTMNDIRLTSRGGARLSDILPNYILKTQEEKTGADSYIITKPNCPKGYKKALAIIPTSWPKTELKVDIPQLDVDIANERTNSKDNVDVKNEVGLCVKVGTTEKATDTEDWSISLGLHDGTDCTANSNIKAIAQTYCVWEPSLYSSQATCEGAGYTWSGSCGGTKTTTKYFADRYKSENGCKKAGGEWDSSRGCKITLPASADAVNNLSKVSEESDADLLARKARLCKMIGAKWNGNSCTAS